MTNTNIEYRVQEGLDSQSITALQRFENGDCLQVELTTYTKGTEIFSAEITEIDSGDWMNSQYHFSNRKEICDGSQIKILKDSREIQRQKTNFDYLSRIFPRLKPLLKNAPILKEVKSHPILKYI